MIAVLFSVTESAQGKTSMRRWVRSIALAMLVAFVVVVGRKGYHDYAAAREVADRKKTMHWLNSLIIQRLNFREASLEEMSAFLNQQIAVAPGRPKDLHIKIASAKEVVAGFHPLVPEEKEPVSLHGGDSGRFTVELTAGRGSFVFTTQRMSCCYWMQLAPIALIGVRPSRSASHGGWNY